MTVACLIASLLCLQKLIDNVKELNYDKKIYSDYSWIAGHY